VGPTIVLFLFTTNQFLTGGSFPTELFRLRPWALMFFGVNLWPQEKSCRKLSRQWISLGVHPKLKIQVSQWMGSSVHFRPIVRTVVFYVDQHET